MQDKGRCGGKKGKQFSKKLLAAGQSSNKGKQFSKKLLAATGRPEPLRAVPGSMPIAPRCLDPPSVL